MSRERNDSLPLWRVLLGILLAVAATVLLIRGSMIIATKDAFSKKVIRETTSKIDLFDMFGKDAVNAINVGIMHLSDSAYTKDLYITEEELKDYVDEKEVRTFVAEKASEFILAMLTDETFSLKAEEISPLLEKLQKHIEAETEMRISDSEFRAEIADAFGMDRSGEYSVSRDDFKEALETEILDTDVELPTLHPGRGVLFVVLGALLLLGVYIALWPRFVASSILCIVSCLALFLCLYVIGAFFNKLIDISEVREAFALDVFSTWINSVSAMFTRRAWLSLIGMIVPVGVMTAYAIDAGHVAKLKGNRQEY